MFPSDQVILLNWAQHSEGTAVNNVELRPGDGGKIARSGGNSCFVESRLGDKVSTTTVDLQNLFQRTAELPLVF